MTDENKKNKRRPGRDIDDEIPSSQMAHQQSEPADHEEMKVEHQAHNEDLDAERKAFQHDEAEKVHVEFYGSELLRAKAPEAFEVIDRVATDWKNDGDFKALPLGHPLLQVVATEGLTRAKKIEKKLEEKGVLSMLRIGVDYAKSKLNKKS